MLNWCKIMKGTHGPLILEDATIASAEISVIIFMIWML